MKAVLTLPPCLSSCSSFVPTAACARFLHFFMLSSCPFLCWSNKQYSASYNPSTCRFFVVKRQQRRHNLRITFSWGMNGSLFSCTKEVGVRDRAVRNR
uniref:Putative secreted protein n=1 Tax=Ixodes scapularis TaxID=6945 RepID=A0A4D5S0I5_IXOSC